MEEIKDKTEEATATENQTAVEQQPTENNPQEDAKTKVYENALRKIFGLSAEEELGDVDRRITELEQKNENIVQAAKSSIITANINAMQGYDTKLLRKVIDLSSVDVDENGNITGLEAAVKTAETEYPAVKLPKENKQPFVPVNPVSTASSKMTMNDLIRGKF